MSKAVWEPCGYLIHGAGSNGAVSLLDTWKHGQAIHKVRADSRRLIYVRFKLSGDEGLAEICRALQPLGIARTLPMELAPCNFQTVFRSSASKGTIWRCKTRPG